VNWYRCWVRRDGTPAVPAATGFNADGRKRGFDTDGHDLFLAWGLDIDLCCGDCGARATLTVTHDLQVRHPFGTAVAGRQMGRIGWSRDMVNEEADPGWWEPKLRDLCPACHRTYTAELNAMVDAGEDGLPKRGAPWRVLS
jgi:hypothetical protein